jgi:hypothetical protein
VSGPWIVRSLDGYYAGSGVIDSFTDSDVNEEHEVVEDESAAHRFDVREEALREARTYRQGAEIIDCSTGDLS